MTLGLHPEADREIRQLQQKLSRQSRQLLKQKQLTDKNREQAALLSHYDTERQVLNDICGTTDAEPGAEWRDLRAQARLGMEAMVKVKENSELLHSAERRVAELLKSKAVLEAATVRLAEAEKRIEQTPMFEQMAAKAEAKVKEIEATTERLRNFADMQKVRFDFARAVAASQHTMAAGLCGLHRALTGEEDGTLRRLVLAVLFLQRWSRLPKTPKGSFDGASLGVFAASTGITSGEEKLARIEQMFAGLTDELCVAKQSIVDERTKTKQLQEKYKEIDGETVALQVDNVKKEMTQYQRRIKDLIAANAEMVAPDRFQEMLSRATEAELANDYLAAVVKLKDEEIDRQAGVIKESTRDIQRADLRHEADVQEVERMKLAVENHQTEIEVLNSKLHDRTKDLLALERMNAYKPPGAFTPERPREDPEETDPMFGSPRINPRFLGPRPNPVE
jgi:hypothetical protein